MIKKGLLKKFEIFGIMTAIAVALAVNYIPVKANITPLLLNSENNKKEMEERPAMIGRLYIPDVGVNVALFDTTGMKYDIGQSYVDAEDSSAWKDKNGIGVVSLFLMKQWHIFRWKRILRPMFVHPVDVVQILEKSWSMKMGKRFIMQKVLTL